MKITIHYIRHGESYANRIQKIFGTFHCCIRDPRLTSTGMEDSKTMVIPPVDYVCCSELVRAKQTARCVCPDAMIYVLPGVRELGMGLDNIPLSYDNQFENFQEISKFIHLPCDVACETFISYLQKHLLKNKSGDVSIALFTHQRFIQKHTGVKNVKNNQIVTKVYDF